MTKQESDQKVLAEFDASHAEALREQIRTLREGDDWQRAQYDLWYRRDDEARSESER